MPAVAPRQVQPRPARNHSLALLREPTESWGTGWASPRSLPHRSALPGCHANWGPACGKREDGDGEAGLRAPLLHPKRSNLKHCKSISHLYGLKFQKCTRLYGRKAFYPSPEGSHGVSFLNMQAGV